MSSVSDAPGRIRGSTRRRRIATQSSIVFTTHWKLPRNPSAPKKISISSAFFWTVHGKLLHYAAAYDTSWGYREATEKIPSEWVRVHGPENRHGRKADRDPDQEPHPACARRALRLRCRTHRLRPQAVHRDQGQPQGRAHLRARLSPQREPAPLPHRCLAGLVGHRRAYRGQGNPAAS